MDHINGEVSSPHADVSSDKPQIKPNISYEQVVGLVRRLYNLQDVVCLTEFISYYNQNFLIEARRPDFEPAHRREKFVMKLTNSEESELFVLHQQQNEILSMLSMECGIPCCYPIKNAAGNDLTLEKLSFKHRDTGKYMTGQFITRIMVYLPGQSKGNVSLQTAKVCYESGQLLGQLSYALQNNSVEKTEFIQRGKELIWSLSNVPRLRDYVFVLQNDLQKKVIAEILDAFEEKVLKIEHKLTKGMIHGDFSDYNVLVRQSSDEDNNVDDNANIRRDVVGILDFDHLMYSCIVYDVAVAIMYQMQCTNLELDPVESGGILLAGFLSKRALSDDEWTVLYYCVAGRFAQSLVIGLHTHSLQPQNDYILSSQRVGWKVLFNFWAQDVSDVFCRWKRLIRQYNQALPNDRSL